MAPHNTNSLDDTARPQFFKVLFPDPYSNLMIPREFHMKLPHKLPKLATLLSPSGKIWHVQISRISEDIYFQKGWSEFAKVHDLQTGHFMVLRYEGNMIFKVKIFDTTGCLKDYSLGSHAWRTKACIENETSLDIGNQKSSKSTHEIKLGILKKRKLANDQALATDKREKGSTSQMVLPKKKKKAMTNLDSTVCSGQFERIIRPYSFSHGFLSIPRDFCVNNGLLTRRTIYLKMSSSGGGPWPVNFYFRTQHGDLGKGWNEFGEAAGLKEGDRCIFRLISENSFVIDVENDLIRDTKGKAMEGSTSLALVEKQYSRPVLECESTVRRCNLTSSYQSLPKGFCLEYNLTSMRDVTLRDLRGKQWHVLFYMQKRYGRLSRKGWTEFSSEYRLEVGDKCLFKLIEKDTPLVRVVKKE